MRLFSNRPADFGPGNFPDGPRPRPKGGPGHEEDP